MPPGIVAGIVRLVLIQRRWTVAVVASWVLAFSAASPVVGGTSGHAQTKTGGRAVAHGPFVPGQTAYVSISRMPRRTPLSAGLFPAGARCFADLDIYCLPQRVVKKARTSSSGRAELNFTMPSEFLVIDFNRPTERQHWQYLSGQPIKIVATASIRGKDHRAQVLGRATANSFVQIPQPTPGA
jgi:hypothetical protein